MCLPGFLSLLSNFLGERKPQRLHYEKSIPCKCLNFLKYLKELG